MNGCPCVSCFRVLLCQGVDSAYDAAMNQVAATEAKLEAYLDSQKELLRCRDAVYFHSKVSNAPVHVVLPPPRTRWLACDAG